MLAGVTPSDVAMLGSERHANDNETAAAQILLRAPMPVSAATLCSSLPVVQTCTFAVGILPESR